VPKDVERLFKESMDAFGRTRRGGSLCGHNAAVSDCPAEMWPPFDKVIATNLRGTFLVFAQAAQHVPDGGRIMAVLQQRSRQVLPDLRVPTIASKAGVEAWSTCLPTNCVAETSRSMQWRRARCERTCFLKGKSDALIDELRKMNPLERIGEPEDFARVVFLPRRPEGAGSIRRCCG